jgi:hypothetical protein
MRCTPMRCSVEMSNEESRCNAQGCRGSNSGTGKRMQAGPMDAHQVVVYLPRPPRWSVWPGLVWWWVGCARVYDP